MKVSCIIPAYNEESTIRQVISAVKSVEKIDEIIVVDDCSYDNTSRYAKEERVTVLRHSENRGKGAAIKTGYENSTGEILLFLDADLHNISPRKITSIIAPLLKDEADFAKTSFRRKRGRVTELVVKPLFKVVFPFMNFNQPLSGQFAIKRELMQDLKIDDKWGVDIQILLQLVKKGVRIKEVDIGFVQHKKQPLEKLTHMSEQVIKTILSELGLIANKHKLIIFDFDKTIIEQSSIEIISKKLGFYDVLMDLRDKKKKGHIKDSDITHALAEELKGRTIEELEEACKHITLQPNIDKVVEKLKKRQYNLAIVSLAFSPVVEIFARRLDIQNVICPILVSDKKNRITGRVLTSSKKNPACCDRIICKHDAAKGLMEKLGIKSEECIAVGDGKSDECLFKACGLSLAYKPKQDIGDRKITHFSEILIYAE